MKTNIRAWTAVAMLTSGVGLSVAGFIAPPFGEISDSVLWFFAQCLIYAGTALGFDVMIETKLRSLSNAHRDGSDEHFKTIKSPQFL